QHGGETFDIASQAAQEVIIVLEIVPKLAAAQPAGDGLAYLSKQGPGQKRQQPPGQASMQQTSHLRDPRRHLDGQMPLCHPWLSCAMRFVKHRYRLRRAVFLSTPLRSSERKTQVFSESAVCWFLPFYFFYFLATKYKDEDRWIIVL